MRKIVWVCYMLILSIFFFVASASSQQVAKTIPNSISPDGRIGFLEFRPKDYGSQLHPLIIFLHGIGERGNGTSQIYSVANNGTPNYCANGASMSFTVKGKTSSFVVLSPQLSTWYGYWPTFYVQEMINYAKANLQIDPNRIYVTGLSLGGGGVWRYATEVINNDYSVDAGIAAIAPVCGTQEEIDANVCNTIGATNLPVWAFHSMDDGTVGVGATQHAEIILNRCGVKPAPKFTYYQNGDHWGAWINAYDPGHITRTLSDGSSFTASPNLYEWFLSNVRDGKADKPDKPSNTAPIANAGAAQTITLPLNIVTLSGTGTGTNGASIDSYSWAKTSGPAAGTLALPLLNETVVTGLVQGVYVFTLTVTDNHGLTSTSSVTITVNPLAQLFNQTPWANAGAPITITLPTNSVTLNGSASSDPDGWVAAYNWTQTGGPTVNSYNRDAAVTTLTGLTAGNYTFVLKVTDNAGAPAYATTTITVNAAPAAPSFTINQNPIANAGANSTITLPDNAVTLDGSASKDPDGWLTDFVWAQMGGPTVAYYNRFTATTQLTGLTDGFYTFILKVTDNLGAIAYSTVYVTVNAASTKGKTKDPVADAGADINVTLPNSAVTLDGSRSKAPGGGWLTEYVWVQMGGPTVNSYNRYAATTQLTGLVAGFYTFILKVTDNNGAFAYSTVYVTVNAAAASGGQPIGYIKTSISQYAACNDASSSGRIPIYSTGIAAGNKVYLDAGLTIPFNGNWNWYSFTQTLGGAVTQSMSIYPTGGIISLGACTVSAPSTPAPSGNLLGYVKAAISPYAACDDRTSDSRIAIYGNSIANGSYLYTDAAMTRIFDGNWNWYSFTPVLGGTTTYSFAVYPIGVMALMRNCATGGSARVAAGSTSEDDIAALRNIKDSTLAASMGISATGKLGIYPNPVRSAATLELNSTEEGMKSVNLYNTAGVMVAKYTWQTIKGRNTFSLKNISGLPNGLYIADIRDSNGKPVGKLKFVKQ